MFNEIMPKWLRYDEEANYAPQYRRHIRRHNRTIFNRRVLVGNILWIVANIVLTKVGIMMPTFGNMLNVAAFLLTAGSIVQKNFSIGKWLWKLESGAVLVSIAIWISNLM